MPNPQNGQTHSNWIIWVCLTIFWGWRLKGYDFTNQESILIASVKLKIKSPINFYHEGYILLKSFERILRLQHATILRI